MSAPTSVPSVGDVVPVSDGMATIKDVGDTAITYDHSEWKTYTISIESFMDYMTDAAGSGSSGGVA